MAGWVCGCGVSQGDETHQTTQYQEAYHTNTPIILKPYREIHNTAQYQEAHCTVPIPLPYHTLLIPIPYQETHNTAQYQGAWIAPRKKCSTNYSII